MVARTAASAAFAAGFGMLLCVLCAPGCLSPAGYHRDLPDGDSGQAGTSGAAGVSGSAGASGKAGTTGTGMAGTTGITGIAGTTGTGKAGTSGTAGTSGLGGTTGRAGTTGSTGTAGTVGTTGVAGTTGATGTAGTTGAGGAGNVLLSEDFETDNASQWFTSGSGTAMVIIDGTHVYELTNLTSKVYLSAAGSVTWTNQVISASIKILSFNGSSSSYYVGLCGRVADGSNYYCAALRSDGKLAIRADLAGSSTTLGNSVNVSPAITTGTFYTVKMEILGSTINVYLNGMLQDTVSDTTIVAGGVGLLVANADAEFDDVLVTSQ
jgi:hypothetical protein